MSVSNQIIEQIQDALDIAEIIGDRVKLKRSSRGYEGLCPFHDEKTPSFHVYTDTQSYYCFGCHEAGNIFTFLMKMENIGFREAVEILADRAGIKLPEYEKKNGEKNSYEILELTAKFYTENLKSSSGVAARAYMERRKLDANDITRFSLGYSLASWDLLVKFLKNSGVSEKQMLNLGLALQGKHGLYDKFRGRIIFPIKDITGRTIAFGGRLIDGEGAKYINSSESEIYSKRKNLYLLDVARKSIREKRRSILVEGYMDAIRLHKCGFTETVASCGTSLTPEQAETLSRFADRCYICYDSDTAGQTATIRGMYILAENGLDVHVVDIPESKDPDEFLSVNTPEKFEEAIQNSKPLVLKHMEILSPAIKDPATRKSAMKELFESLSRLNIAEVLQFKIQLSELTCVPPSKIEEWFVSKQKHPIPDEQITPVDNEKIKIKGIEQPCEAGLCSLLFRYAECRISMKPSEALEIIRNPTAREIALAFLRDNPDDLMAIWSSVGETGKFALLARGDEFCAQMKGLTLAEKWRNTYYVLKEKHIAKRVKELTAKMQNSQATPQELLELRELKGKIQENAKKCINAI